MPSLKKSVAFEESVGRAALPAAGEQLLQAMRIKELYAEHVAKHGPVPEHIRRDVEAEWQPELATALGVDADADDAHNRRA